MAKYVAGPFDGEHLYVQWGGTLPGGDIFSCGIRMANQVKNSGLNDITDDVAQRFGEACGRFHLNPQSFISPAAVMTYAKANVIGIDGKYKYPLTHEYTPVGIPGGGGDLYTYPNQVTLAVSTLSAVSRGPAHRGRFYLPMPTAPVQVDGMITANNANAVRLSADTFIAELNAVDPAQWFAAIFSRKSPGAAHRQIVATEVGRVYDTQRRRRNALSENYSHA